VKIINKKNLSQKTVFENVSMILIFPQF
jgi:hypothetical protein